MGVASGIHTWLGSSVGLWVMSRLELTAPLNTVISSTAAITSTATAIPANISIRRLPPDSSSSSGTSSRAAVAADLRWAM